MILALHIAKHAQSISQSIVGNNTRMNLHNVNFERFSCRKNLLTCFAASRIMTSSVFRSKEESYKRGGEKMEIRVGENESLESALKRFKRKCARSGVLAEVRRREHYEKPSVKRKKKAEAARKRKY